MDGGSGHNLVAKENCKIVPIGNLGACIRCLSLLQEELSESSSQGGVLVLLVNFL